MVNVCCVYVKGHVPFTVDYVVRLHSMVKRNMTMPFTFVVFTDRIFEVMQAFEAIGETRIQYVSVETPIGHFGWWSKIQLFNPHNGLKGRCFYLDLDTLVISPLGQVVEYPYPFALVPHAGNFDGKNGLKVIKRFNSSVMVWDAGKAASVIYDKWKPATTKRLWGDQDHIAEVIPEAAKFPAEWFPRISEITQKDFTQIPRLENVKVILCKKPKNDEAAQRWPWVKEIWK